MAGPRRKPTQVRHTVRKATPGMKSQRLARATSKFGKGSTSTFSETGTAAKRSVRKADVYEGKSYAKARTKTAVARRKTSRIKRRR